MYRWAKGILGTGLSRSSKGMLPSPAARPADCPCEFEVYHGWDGPQVVSRFYYPYGSDVDQLKVVRQLKHYPYDHEDGQLVHDETGPFTSTAVTNTVILASVDAAAGPIFSTLETSASNDDSVLTEITTGEVFQAGTLWIEIVVGAVTYIILDNSTGGFEIALDGSWSGAAVAYVAAETVEHNDLLYTCTVNHVSAAITEPGVGANWMTVWALGGTVLTGSSVNYCTHQITLNLAAPHAPDAASAITMVTYNYMDQEEVSTLARGTISGGVCTANVGDVDYTAWSGYVNGNAITIAAGTYVTGGPANDTYYLVVDEDGVLSIPTTIPDDQELLCEFDIAAAVVTEVRNRQTTLITDPDSGYPFEFFYYSVFIYSSSASSWLKCSGTDYTIEYDTQFLQAWLYNHTPRQWRTDDRKTDRIILYKATIDDGQQINIHEGGEMRGQLYRWLKWFGLEFERDRAYIRALALLYIDANQAPPPVLQLMAAAMGYRLPQGWDLMKQRLYVKQITAVWRKKGTEEAVLMAAYRSTGIMPAVGYIYDRLLYSNMYTRHSLNTTAVGGIETPADPHHYMYGPDREDHYHERGLNLFFTDPASSLTTAYNRVLKRFVSGNTSGIMKTVGAHPLVDTLDPIVGTDFILPNSVTITWTSAAVSRAMKDDGWGGFAGDGNPAESSIDYKTKEIVLDTRALLPDQGTAITIAFTSTASGIFRRLVREVADSVVGTGHVAYYVNDYLMKVSD